MTRLVFSYSHVDEGLRDELEKHLSPMRRQGLIDSWHDRRITAGKEWAGQIDQNFEEADVILLLVSPDFINSDYCYDVEMARALERHKNRSAIVIPVILRPCDWTSLPFGKLQAATKNGKPVTHYPSLDDGFLEVAVAIKKALPKQSSNPVVYTELPPRTQATRLAVARSSAMSIRQEFSDLERDQALNEGFTAIVGYIEASLAELEARNKGIKTTCRRVDANSAEFSIYRNGNRVGYAGIWISHDGRWGHLKYSSSGLTQNSYNESMSVEDDGYVLGFKPMGVAMFQDRPKALLTAHGAGEYFWELLTGQLR